MSCTRESASGSITKSRDVETQAVISLRGKSLNSFGFARKIAYENEEFALLPAPSTSRMAHGQNTPERQDYIIENLREDVDRQIHAAVA